MPAFVLYWDRAHVKTTDSQSISKPTNGLKLCNALERLGLTAEHLAIARTALGNAKLIISTGCTALEGNDWDLEGSGAPFDPLVRLLRAEEPVASAVRRACLQLLETDEQPEDEPLQVAHVVRRLPKSTAREPVMSVCSVELASVTTGNAIAATAHRALKRVASACQRESDVLYVLFTRHNQPLDLANITNRFPNDFRAKLAYWLRQAGFDVAGDECAARPPETGRGYFVVLTRGAELHAHCVEALLELLEQNAVRGAEVLVDARPAPPLRAVFTAEAAASIFSRECERVPAINLARTHVWTAPVASGTALGQLRELGVDMEAHVNERMVAAMTHSTLLSARTMLWSHLVDLLHANYKVRTTPLLGDEIKNQRSANRDEMAGNTAVNVRVCADSALLPRFDVNGDRRSQLAGISCNDVLGIFKDEMAKCHLLFHGTTIEHATNIATNGPVAGQDRSSSHDFGQAFYTTPDFHYALETAYEVSGGMTNSSTRHHDPAVIAFVIPNDKWERIPQYQIAAQDWPNVVRCHLRNCVSELDVNLAGDIEDATTIIGPSAANGTTVTGGHAMPIRSTFTQCAFRKTRQAKRIGRGDGWGRLIVLRVNLTTDFPWGDVPHR